MQTAPKMGFLHLVSDIKRAPFSHIFILEGEPDGRSGFASAIASQLGRQVHKISNDPGWPQWLATIPREEQSGYILFFDEADALFGKRTTVNDSHQRYAELSGSFAGLIFLGVEKSYTLPTGFTQCAKTIVVRNYWP